MLPRVVLCLVCLQLVVGRTLVSRQADYTDSAGEQLPSASDYYYAPPVWNHHADKVAVLERNTVKISSTLSSTSQAIDPNCEQPFTFTWSPDDTQLAVVCYASGIQIRDSANFRLIRELKGFDAPILAVAWSPDGTKFVATKFEAETGLIVWETKAWSKIGEYKRLGGAEIVFSPDGHYLVTILGGVGEVLDTATFSLTAQFGNPIQASANLMENIDWSPDSRQIVTGSINGVIYVWNAETGEALARFAANPHAVFDELTGPKFPLLGWVRDVRFMPDGNTILSASADGTVQLYDIATQKAVETKQYAQIAAASFSPLTTRLAYLSFTVSDSGFPAGVTIRQRLSSKGLEMDVPFANRERFNRLVAVCGVTADSSASPESVLNTLGTRKDDPHAALCVNELSPMAAGLKNAP